MHAKETQKVSRGKKTAASKKPTSQYRSCLQTYIGITYILIGGTRLIPVKADIFGYEYMEAIGREDIDQVFQHLTLGLGVIDTYIRYTPINFV